MQKYLENASGQILPENASKDMISQPWGVICVQSSVDRDRDQ